MRQSSSAKAAFAAALAIALGALPGAAAAGNAHLLYLSDNSAAVDHAAIIRAFEDKGFTVDTYAYAGEDRIAYARRIAGEVRDLMQHGVDPSDISVLGGGSGADVALLASAVTGNRHVNFVVLGSCDRALKDDHTMHLSGNVLALRDASDSASQSCRPLFTGSPRLRDRKDLVLANPYGTGLFNSARDEWTKPAAQWMSSGHVDVGDVKVAMTGEQR